MKILGKNKKAYFDYEIISEYEAGIALQGWEVKSIKANTFSLKESHVADENGEMWLYGMHVPKWKAASMQTEVNETRKRKLLLHKKEITKLTFERQRSSYALIPLNIHLSKGKIKVQIALARGKKQSDKRDKLKEKDQTRSVERELKKIGY